MDATEEIAKWVEEKIGHIVESEIEEHVKDANKSFDVERCSEKFTNLILRDLDVLSRPASPDFHLDFDSDFSVDGSEKDVFQDSLDLSTLPLEEVLVRLESGSERDKVDALMALESSPVEDLIAQRSWTLTRKILQDILRTHYNDRRIPITALKIFKRLLMSYDVGKVVSEGFTTLAECVTFQVGTFHPMDSVTMEQIYDLKENRLLKGGNYEAVSRCPASTEMVACSLEVITRSLELLLDAQTMLSSRWARFNEKKLHDIVFAFIGTLSLSVHLEEGRISALEIVSLLDPYAEWCQNWCHGATGRSLLCLALRRHKRLIVAMIDIILNVRTKDKHLRARTSGQDTNKKQKPTYKKYEGNIARSAPKEKIPTTTATWLAPSEVTKKAKFCHSFSLVTNILQYRAGRSLFPLKTRLLSRQLTIQDLVSTMMNYIDITRQEQTESNAYLEHLNNMRQILTRVKTTRTARRDNSGSCTPR